MNIARICSSKTPRSELYAMRYREDTQCITFSKIVKASRSEENAIRDAVARTHSDIIGENFLFLNLFNMASHITFIHYYINVNPL